MLLMSYITDTSQNLKNVCFRFMSWLRLLFITSLFFTLATTVNAQIPLQSQLKTVDKELRNKVAQKLFIDLRYYCTLEVKGYCQEPMQALPPDLENMLSKAKVGGVILFAENLRSSEQIIALNHDLQMANAQGINAQNYDLENTIPLYIGIDQEGGRVSRLPQEEFLGFAGNMAIGATFAKQNTQFATQVSEKTASYLNSLGFNVNFAPVLDVNNNPDNPIINVRAYSQSPDVVAALGGASIKAMQENQISVAAKHFPGHGDTETDSHIGLPIVKHSKKVIREVDLFPFAAVIKKPSTRPDMIMTAHIQYPKLDNTPFRSEEEATQSEEDKQFMQSAVLPATLSRIILHDLLREEMNYDGLIITDALDMASISKFLTPLEAVIQSFRAGADITLMPYRISSKEEAVGFLDWLNQLTIIISQDADLVDDINASYERIIAHKEKRKLRQWPLLTLDEKLLKVTETHSSNEKKALDEALALSLSQASFTQIKGLGVPLTTEQNILAFMPDKRRCLAFEYYWLETQAHQLSEKSVEGLASPETLADNSPINSGEFGELKCVSLLSEAIELDINRLEDVDAVIVGDVFPPLSFFESKAFEGIHAKDRLDVDLQRAELSVLIEQAKSNGIPSILVKMRSPYVTKQEVKAYDAIYASYDYQVTERFFTADGEASDQTSVESKKLFSPVFDTLLKVVLGKHLAQGDLPVVLEPEVVSLLAPSEEKKSTY